MTVNAPLNSLFRLGDGVEEELAIDDTYKNIMHWILSIMIDAISGSISTFFIFKILLGCPSIYDFAITHYGREN